MTVTGRFITIEGGEGAGKSTRIRLPANALETAGLEVVVTREPGGSTGAEEIRGLLLGGGLDRWDTVTEALLVNAARRDHLVKTIWPALARGAWVICDRFEDSTRAYQGAGGLDAGVIAQLGAVTKGGFAPDLTLILDLPVPIGRARAAARRGVTDRFETRDDAFHERVRAIFLGIATAEPERCALIDASEDIAAVAGAIRRVTETKLGVRLLG